MCYPVWGEHASHLWSLWPPEVNEKNVRGESWMTKKHWNPPSLLVGASLYPSLGDVLRSTVPPTPKNQCITCMFRGGPKKLIFQDLVLNQQLLWWNNNLSIATPAGGEKRREESFCWDVAVNWATLSTCPPGHTTDKLSHVNIVWVHSTCWCVCRYVFHFFHTMIIVERQIIDLYWIIGSHQYMLRVDLGSCSSQEWQHCLAAAGYSFCFWETAPSSCPEDNRQVSRRIPFLLLECQMVWRRCRFDIIVLPHWKESEGPYKMTQINRAKRGVTNWFLYHLGKI